MKQMRNKEIKSEIDAIRNEYGEMIFRMGITHLISKGFDHFNGNVNTKDDIQKYIDTVKVIIEKQQSGSEGTPVLSIDFQLAIVECAIKLSFISPVLLLTYISKYVEYDN